MRVFRVVVCLALASGLVAQDDAAELVRKLGLERDHRARNDAYRELLTRKPPDAVPLLIKAIPGFQVHSQSLAMQVLQRYPRDVKKRAWQQLAKSDSSYVAALAAMNLMQRFGDTAQRSRLAGFVRKAKGNELNQLLGRLRHVKLPGLSEAVLSHLRADVPVHTMDAILGHALHTGSQEALPMVRKLLAAGSLGNEERALCGAFLAAMGDQSQTKELAAAIRASKHINRLRDYLQRAPSLDREVLAAVLDFIDGKKGRQVADALRLMARHDYGPAVRPMRELAESADREVSKAAFDGLMRMGTGLEPKHLYRMLDNARPQIVIRAADALRRLDDHKGLDRLIPLTKGGGGGAGRNKNQDRLDAVDALGKFRHRKAVPALIDLLADRDQNVRQRAYNGLQRILRGMFPYRALDLAGTGYVARGNGAARQEAIAKIRNWWMSMAASRKKK